MNNQINNSSPIGVFDSGSGGLSVLKELKKIMPNENFIYFGDTKRMPYGDKTPEQLMAFCLEIIDWFEKQGTKAVISACNTSSAVVLPFLKRAYPFDIFGMIEPTSEYVASLSFKKVGIIATAATIKTSAYKKNITAKNPTIAVYEQACPGIVQLIESNEVNSEKCYKLLETYLRPLMEQQIQALVLGCTHYPILDSLIHEITNHKAVQINPALVVAKSVKESLGRKNLLNDAQKEGSTLFYASKNPQLFEEVGRQLYYKCKDAKLLTL